MKFVTRVFLIALALIFFSVDMYGCPKITSFYPDNYSPQVNEPVHYTIITDDGGTDVVWTMTSDGQAHDIYYSEIFTPGTHTVSLSGTWNNGQNSLPAVTLTIVAHYNLAVSSGSGQTIAKNGTGSPLVAIATDAYGYGVAYQSVTFTPAAAVTSGIGTTGSDGTVSTGLVTTTAGNVVVTGAGVANASGTAVFYGMILGVDITGPNTVAVGQTVNMTANAVPAISPNIVPQNWRR